MGFRATPKGPGTPERTHLQGLSVLIYKTTELAQMISEVQSEHMSYLFQKILLAVCVSATQQQEPLLSFALAHPIYNTGPGATC